MNILILTPFFSAEGYEDVWNINYDPQGGMQLMISRLAKAMRRNCEDATIDVITMGQPAIPHKRVYSKGINIISCRIPIPKIKSSLGGYCGLIKAWAVSSFFYLNKQKKKYDIVFAHADGSGTALLLYYLAQRILKIPLFLQIHSSRGATQTATSFFENLTNKLATKMELKTVDSAAKIYTLSDQTTEYFRHNCSKELPIRKIIYLPDLECFLNFDNSKKNHVFPISKDKTNILYLGRVSAEKGCDVFLDIAKRLDPQRYHIVFCGDGPELKKIKKQAEKDQTIDMFSFLGFVGHDLVPEVIEKCDIGIVPSKYEELGTVILELMASKKPVIAHDLSTVRQIIEHNKDGILVKKGDINGMCSAIERVSSDKVLHRVLVENAYDKAKSLLSIDDVAVIILEDILNSLGLKTET